MTKKHFIAIAKLINRVTHNDQKPGCFVDPLEQVAQGLADICQEQNENFKREKFISACGFQEKNNP